LGLIGVSISERVAGLSWMKQADAVAAIGVACIVVFVSYQLGKRTIAGLLDTAPKGLEEKVRETVLSKPGVLDCHQIRIRSSGPETFIDVHIFVKPEQSISETHQLTDQIEHALREIVADADITVHPEPEGCHPRQPKLVQEVAENEPVTTQTGQTPVSELSTAHDQ